jgi:hypothetical protein
MKGTCGYGRYDDDPNHVGCPRAKSDMTPCIARDGALALADNFRCVGCNAHPKDLLDELRGAGVNTGPTRSGVRGSLWDRKAADKLRDVVRKVTQPTEEI